VDLICTDPWFVVDFKTKEFGPEDDLKTWDEQAMQLAAYREGQQAPLKPASACEAQSCT
jgi:hypothetical protein